MKKNILICVLSVFSLVLLISLNSGFVNSTCNGTLQCGKIAEFGLGAAMMCSKMSVCSWSSSSNLCSNVPSAGCADVKTETCATVGCVGCVGDETQSCSNTISGVGTCSGTQTRTCDSASDWSAWSTCSAKIPAAESCNGVDDNCDGYTDNAPDVSASNTLTSSQSCAIANGVGIQFNKCTSGSWSDYGSCTVVSCNAGYKILGNSCIPSTDSNNGKTCSSLGLFTSTTGCYGITGWKPLTDINWTLTSKNALNISMLGAIVSDFSFDLKVGEDYNLSYITTEQNPGCIVTMDFNDNDCTSFDTLTTKKCFDILDTNGKPQVFKDDSGSQAVNRHVSYKFNIPYNTDYNADATNGAYFKDVKLRITVLESTQGACSDVLIQNISLKEMTNVEDNIAYNNSQVDSLGTAYTAGCCPINYCWNGVACVDSALWMTNASYPPIWNSIWSANWTNTHVNTSNQQDAVGYRCVIINDTTNESQWVPTKIKYDWNYQASGYCANITDCFVNTTFNASKQSTADYDYNGYSMGCIRNGDIISAEKKVGQGNHYCYMGNWTTRSYIVAKVLQNISIFNGDAYILQCYDNTSLTYNKIMVNGVDKILSACVIVMKDAPNNKEQVITGVVLKNDDDASSFMDDIASEYGAMHSSSDNVYKFNDCITDSTHDVSDSSNFTKCAEQSGSSNSGGLYVYYEKQYKYFIISDRLVVGIEQRPFWDSVVRFFQTFLFGSQITHTTSFDAINYVTNYDRIYVMQNNTLNVSGIEESKYDEGKGRVVNILYVKYSGANTTNNPINRDDLFNIANHTMTKAGKADAVPVEMNYTNDTTAKTQEIIIKTEDRTGLWSYFTSILRNRNP